MIKLFSSRYNLRICCLDSAENFHAQMIDNEVCFHWSPDSAKGMGFTRFPSPNDSSYRVNKLRYHDEICEQELLYQDREYLWAAVNWISFFEQSCLDNYYKIWIEEEMPVFVDFPLPGHPMSRLKKQIYSVIYREFDFTTAEKTIASLLETINNNDFKEPRLFFNSWL